MILEHFKNPAIEGKFDSMEVIRKKKGEKEGEDIYDIIKIISRMSDNNKEKKDNWLTPNIKQWLNGGPAEQKVNC